ncbi:cellulase family glycosylhydrolase [Glycomyces sp. NPDC047369]
MAPARTLRQFHRAATAAVLSALAVFVAAGLFVLGLPSTPASAQTQGTGTGFLSTDGSRIVDETGAEVRLTGINWFGMETDNHTFHGLWANAPATWSGQLDRMAELGFNTLRIPYTGDSLRPDAEATSINDYTNPDLVGLHPLEILDKVIDHAGDLGMRVILDRHRPSAAGQTALWYTPQVSEQSIIDDWTMLAERYAGNPTVVGADLFNEPHAEGTLPNATGACWGCGVQSRDWRLAAERIGNAILDVNPDWLILVEGVSTVSGGLTNQWDNDPATDDESTWWGGNLSAAFEYPVRLDVADKLVYSAHDYAISVYDRQPWFEDPDFPNNLPEVWDHFWGDLHKQDVAPVLVGEFGSTLANPLDTQWLNALMDYMTDNGMSFTFWAWNPNSGDTGGLVDNDWWTVNQTKFNILEPHLNPPVPDGNGSGETTSPPTQPTGACTATYAITGGWPGNFQANITVKNTGSTSLNGWTVKWTYAGDETIYNSWSTQLTQSAKTVTAKAPASNATLAAGQSTTFGLQGTYTGTAGTPQLTCTA